MNELALAAADGDQRVDGFESRLHGLGHGLSRDDAGGLDLGAAARHVLEGTRTINRLSEAIDDAAQQTFADRARRQSRPCA